MWHMRRLLGIDRDRNELLNSQMLSNRSTPSYWSEVVLARRGGVHRGISGSMVLSLQGHREDRSIESVNHRSSVIRRSDHSAK
jgi:hypothetical protein